VARLIWWTVIVAALFFGAQCGEYSSMDLVRQHRAQRTIERQIDSLRTVVDSLQRQISAALTDLPTQERIAREEFGMVRGDKEILYRFAEPSREP
jgi:cell division protein FtsB